MINNVNDPHLQVKVKLVTAMLADNPNSNEHHTDQWLLYGRPVMLTILYSPHSYQPVLDMCAW